MPWHLFWAPLLLAGGLSYLLTWGAKSLAAKFGWYAYKTKHQVHDRPIARLGGVAIFLSFVMPFLIFLELTPPRIGLLLAVTIVFLMGLWDDLFNVRPWAKIVLQVAAIAVAIAFGLHIGQVSNPFGGVIILPIFWDIFFTALWLWLVTNAMNLLDGLDGLAGGVGAIAAVTLFVLSLFTIVNQPETAIMAIVLLGAVLGFLWWNWYPAKIFMGDSGSYTLGFLVGGLAIISGAKLATAALVLGFPLLDMLWAGFRRLRLGRHPFSADREHLHHRLLDVGIPHQGVVLITLSVVALFAFISLLSGTKAKLALLALVALLMVIVLRTVIFLRRRKRKS
ncbi:hypothetical protein A2V68_00445 [candidate division Kazan bacterium RBG_13_50_9]|uniref:Undecaprenyl-phosphate alpha-N-acetylglucosaminyl 1-phosphate transferase n=1 Tax=candidate division Kazan bacterium RBG_13_50_9 TaxID=1798535 RepID=A0A1F4NSC0_UNCK3|nr:MAG: hypothetical protein A2V68_00445 [candidate division Kazan bacterium RBG_13_50_9]